MDIIKINYNVRKYHKDLVALVLRPSLFKIHTNQQGWLPPAALSGCGGRDMGIPKHITFIIYFNSCWQLTNITSRFITIEWLFRLLFFNFSYFRKIFIETPRL